MKLGLHSAILADYNLEESLAIAQKHGYTSLEVCCWPSGKDQRRYAGVTHIDVSDFHQEDADKIKALFEKYQIEIAVLGYYPNPLSPDPETAQVAIDHLKKVITAAKLLGVNKVSTFIGKDKNKNDEENLKLFKEVWVPLIIHAEAENVWVGIENCPMYFTMDEWPGGLNLASSPALWERIFTIIDSDYLGLTYDPSHLYYQGMDYIQPIHDFKNKIRHVHIKDALVYPEKQNQVGIFSPPLTYMSPKIPGHGGIHWGKFISTLQDIRYKESIVVEIEDKSFEDSQEAVLESLSIARRYLNQYL